MDVEITGLEKRFGSTVALRLPELVIGSGETFGLVGSNGAGKTTFLRLALDLLRPSAGAVLVDGYEVTRSFGWKASTGSYLDESFLIEFLTADEYLAFVGGAYGYSP
ncbi:MAG: ATP-binding cassette domain-containing protein, partial [Rhodothermia bacterium]|nr:ATP-binding cassette domain-containing protein [Rhodothermia bacterium]